MTPDTYTAEEFADCYWKRGYGKKRHALEWIDRTGVTVLTESDFERCYHEMQNEMILPHNTVLQVRTEDTFAPYAV